MAVAPTGTVTFLFTDIEGSTRLWEREPAAMREALARHDAILRRAVETAGGHVFKTVGDAFHAAFETAPAAVSAAVAAQHALLRLDAPAVGPLRVRVAIHTGAAEHRDGDYFGPPLNRVARLLAAAHGGQILLTQTAAELVQEAPPAGVSLRDLGEHRFRDLTRVERVAQVLAPGLPAEFPPIRSLATIPNNLPHQPTSFVGRERERETAAALLGRSRLLTLTGAGGVGKTRLSLQIAAEQLDGFPDGAWLVELAPVAEAALVPQTVAAVFGLREVPGRPVIATLVEELAPRRLLLVLDNCEHLVGACAALADTLLRQCAHLRILATSREALGIAGEVTYRVPSLTLPDPDPDPAGAAADADRALAATLTQFEAVRLFIDRAVAVQPAFAVTNENAPAVAHICHRLDGIPLALELAAARVRALSVEQIAARLDDRFRLLTGGSRTALPRQQTLRALIDWSYQLLSEPERVLLRRFAVFAGGWTLEAAEAVGAGDPIEPFEVLDLLTALVDKSLVLADAGAAVETRYRLLETVREYAQERLVAADETAALRARHRRFMLDLAEVGEREMFGPRQRVWVHRLDRERDNLRVALEPGPDGEAADERLRIAAALGWYWAQRGLFSEARELTDAALAASRTDGAVRAKALGWAGWIAGTQGDFGRSDAYLDASTQIALRIGDRAGLAHARLWQGALAQIRGNPAAALAPLDESVAVFREIGNRWGIGLGLAIRSFATFRLGDIGTAQRLIDDSLTILREVGEAWALANCLLDQGLIAMGRPDYPAARRWLDECLALARETGNLFTVVQALLALGDIERIEGQVEAAARRYEECLPLCRSLGMASAIASLRQNLGQLALARGDVAGAAALTVEALRAFEGIDDRRGVAECLAGLAAVSRRAGDPVRAARLLGAADAILAALGAELSRSNVADYERNVAAVRRALGEAAFDAARAAGAALPLPAAADEAAALA